MAIKIASLMLLTMFGLPERMEIVAPGIEGAFVLTAEQTGKLAAVQQEVFGTEAVAAAEKTRKSKDATGEQKKAARKTLREAGKTVREKAAPILTAEQNELAKKLNAAFAEMAKALVAEYKDKLAAAKDNEEEKAKLRKEMTEKGKAELAKKLEGILTKDQKAGMAKAAAKAKKGQRRMLRLRELQQAIKGGGRRGRR